MTTADRIIDIARSQIGTYATDVKRCKYNTWYYGYEVSGRAYDWCEVFVQWVFSQAGASELLYTKTANCGYAAKAFQNKNRLVTSGFKRGDVVFFHWSNEESELVPGTYVSDHVGIIESVNDDGTITTIEGNTGSSYNGAVMRRVRSLECVSCAGRPDYSGSGDSDEYPDVMYRVRGGGHWYKEVDNLSSYAGETDVPITDVAIKVSRGFVKYRVHIKDGDWLPYVTGYDINDDENGYAGDGKPIDAIEVYYDTPSDLVNELGYYLKAKYRVAPVGGKYFDWQYDDETENGQDGYAGDIGRECDWFQITLAP